MTDLMEAQIALEHRIVDFRAEVSRFFHREVSHL